MTRLKSSKVPMDHWPYEVSNLTQVEIAKFVNDANWQTFRLSLKGISTGFKLRMLQQHRASCKRLNGRELSRADQVRIDNYINALKRGGQLDASNKVVK